MPRSLLTSAKDILGQGRDYTQLVKQVKDILPQFSDDQVCDALFQSEDDIGRAIELLMTQQPTTKSKKKGNKNKTEKEPKMTVETTAPVEVEPSASIPVQEEAEVRESERPKTQAEKEAAKLRKKLREIERIEEKVQKGEKVDQLQLPKLEKKWEVEQQLLVLDQKIKEEEEERQWQEVELQKDEACEPYNFSKPYAEPYNEVIAPQYQEPVETWVPESAPTQPTHQTMSTDLLSMLKNPQNTSYDYEHSKQLAAQLSANRTVQGGSGSGWQPSNRNYGSQGYGHYGGQQYGKYKYSQNWKQDQWKDNGRWKEDRGEKHEKHEKRTEEGGWEHLYSTPLDVSSIPADKRAEAERIAMEIEQGGGGGGGGGGGYPSGNTWGRQQRRQGGYSFH